MQPYLAAFYNRFTAGRGCKSRLRCCSPSPTRSRSPSWCKGTRTSRTARCTSPFHSSRRSCRAARADRELPWRRQLQEQRALHPWAARDILPSVAQGNRPSAVPDSQPWAAPDSRPAVVRSTPKRSVPLPAYCCCRHHMPTQRRKARCLQPPSSIVRTFA